MNITDKRENTTGMLVESVTSHITRVTYRDGTQRFIHEPMTLEELANIERQDEWTKAQLEANRK